MRNLIKWVRGKLHRLWFAQLSPQDKAKAMKSKCYFMGDNVSLFTSSLGTEPYLLSIHDNVMVAAGVQFITHDVSCFTMSRYLGLPDDKPLDKVAPITLWDNCMIGAFSILMPGCSVGKNSVVATGSVVTKQIPDNEVWGGVPAKFIMTTEEYAHKLYDINERYPWKKDGKFIVPQGSEELIKMRQEYFFGGSNNDK